MVEERIKEVMQKVNLAKDTQDEHENIEFDSRKPATSPHEELSKAFSCQTKSRNSSPI